MQTASVSVYGVDNNKLDNVPLLFDCGSQRSYVSDKLRKQLKLPTLRSEKISVNIFGNKQSVTKMVDVVQLKFVLKDKIIQIECLCTSLICNDTVNQDIMSASSSYPHLKVYHLRIPQTVKIEQQTFLLEQNITGALSTEMFSEEK